MKQLLFIATLTLLSTKSFALSCVEPQEYKEMRTFVVGELLEFGQIERTNAQVILKGLRPEIIAPQMPEDYCFDEDFIREAAFAIDIELIKYLEEHANIKNLEGISINIGELTVLINNNAL